MSALPRAYHVEIEITNFTTSWSDGLAMCALIHRHCPDLLDFAKLAAPNVTPVNRLSEAFNMAEKVFHMPEVVSATDFIACSNDERCIIAVVATWYHRLNENRNFKRSSNRLGVVLNRAVTAGRHMTAYIREVYNLRNWMKSNLRFLEELSTFKDIQIISKKLNQWRKKEKQKRSEAICQIEFMWLNLKGENLAWGYRTPNPPTGFEFPTIYKIWLQLEEMEKVCAKRIQSGIEAESRKMTHLEKFNKKAELHKMWLLESEQLLEMTSQSDARTSPC
ncbi:unnamed protein product [Rodentolepis nana]|uniref:Calponin-homology (CH) domain-containing protein n=1 Tax=Rodentolepis nana TaxID=102285 RepID=A0A0R3TFR5_RODNA|nr:unnamed protein product [Rodentolepis nana]